MKRRGEPQRQASGGEGARALPPGASTPSPGGGHFYFGQTPDISTLRGQSGGGRLDSLSATRGARWGARVGTVAGKMVASEVADVGRR